jgi:hypothetical protein
VLVAPKRLRIGIVGLGEDLIGEYLELPYKRDDSGIGCSGMGVIEEYRGLLKDLKLD